MRKQKLNKLILRESELVEIIGVSCQTIRRWVKAGTFPKPIQLSERRIGWEFAAIKEWLEKRKNGENFQGTEPPILTKNTEEEKNKSRKEKNL